MFVAATDRNVSDTPMRAPGSRTRTATAAAEEEEEEEEEEEGWSIKIPRKQLARLLSLHLPIYKRTMSKK
jgi:hypothetical protein